MVGWLSWRLGSPCECVASLLERVRDSIPFMVATPVLRREAAVRALPVDYSPIPGRGRTSVYCIDYHPSPGWPSALGCPQLTMGSLFVLAPAQGGPARVACVLGAL